MKRKDPLKILTSQTKANVSFLKMNSPNGPISSNVALNRRKLRKLLFTHYLKSIALSRIIPGMANSSGMKCQLLFALG